MTTPDPSWRGLPDARGLGRPEQGEHSDRAGDGQQQHLECREAGGERVVAETAVEEPGRHADQARRGEESRGDDRSRGPGCGRPPR